jgi:hypothetical protein
MQATPVPTGLLWQHVLMLLVWWDDVCCTQHPWLTMDPSAHKVKNPAAATALGAHMVRRLRGFAKLSHLKRLALVVMAQSLTDKDVSKLRVSLRLGLCHLHVGCQ